LVSVLVAVTHGIRDPKSLQITSPAAASEVIDRTEEAEP
jgi:hypothetical protein